jgi:uncharacterized protein (TIGR00730 family)
MTNRLKRVGVFCSGKTDIKQEYIERISEILKQIDPTKTELVYGGGNVGLMGVIRQAFAGKVISSNMECFVDRDPTAPKDDYVFDNINDRQSKLIELSDMFLVLPGGFGTLYECLEVITKNQIGEISKKVVIFNYNGVYNSLFDLFTKLRNEGFVKKPLHQYNIMFLTENDIDILIQLLNE